MKAFTVTRSQTITVELPEKHADRDYAQEAAETFLSVEEEDDAEKAEDLPLLVSLGSVNGKHLDGKITSYRSSLSVEGPGTPEDAMDELHEAAPGVGHDVTDEVVTALNRAMTLMRRAGFPSEAIAKFAARWASAHPGTEATP